MSEHANPFQIDGETLVQQGAAALDLLAEHFKTIAEKSIVASPAPGELASQFKGLPSEVARPFQDLLSDIQHKIMPGITHWQHPGFFAYYPSTSSTPAILAEMILSGLGVVGLQWSASPIATELEVVVMDWLMKMMHAPIDSPFLHTSRKGGGLIQNTAGEAMVVVMTAARIAKHMERKGQTTLEGMTPNDVDSLYYADSSKLVVYISDQAHFSGEKAARVAGMKIRKIPARILDHGNLGIDARDVEPYIKQDKADGLIPCLVFLTYGSTNTCGFDDIGSFERLATQENLWIHVDAAYAGASLILPEFKKEALAIQETATSFNFNGSKWFLSGFDSAFLFVKDRQWFKNTFAADGAYLASTEGEGVYNPEFRDWAVPLGRRFRSLRIWMVLEYFGTDSLQEFLRGAIHQADWLRQKIDQAPQFEHVFETNLGLVCFRLSQPLENKTADFVEALKNAGGKYLVYPSRHGGRPFIRVALGGVHTTKSHVEEFWELCLSSVDQLKNSPP